MYAVHFGLKELPFSILPSPRHLYLSQGHAGALAQLLHGVGRDDGFIVLVGKAGTGKTTLCRHLLEQLPEGVATALILNPQLGATEFLRELSVAFGLDCPQDASLQTLQDRLGGHLVAADAEGKQCLLIVDEAQGLAADFLGELRALTNLETNNRKLLQIVLLGQPGLLALLTQPGLWQLHQRVTVRCQLGSLGRKETAEYIHHRLAVAGAQAPLFSAGALWQVHRETGGVPRLINLLCDQALQLAYSKGKTAVSWLTVAQAARQARRWQSGGAPSQWRPWGAVAATLALTAAAYLLLGTPAGRGWQETLLSLGQAREQPLPDLLGHEHPWPAYHDLFALWGLAFEDKQSAPCELAGAVGLGCHEVNASLDALMALNRPAVLQVNGQWFTLKQARDLSATASVWASSNPSLTLIAGGRQYEVSAASLASSWEGQARLLWRLPPDYSAPLKPRDTGKAVDWLVAQLAQAAGEQPAKEAGLVYDEAVQAKVSAFQAAVGLAPLGLVDVPTWIHLNSVEAAGIPLLTQAPAEDR